MFDGIIHNRHKLRKFKQGMMNMENIKIVELTSEQQNTIDQAFKTEHLKDEIEMAKLFDFNFDDE